MTTVLRLSIVYALTSAAVAVTLHGFDPEQAVKALALSVAYLWMVIGVLKLGLPILAIGAVIVGWRELLQRLPAALQALLATALFLGGFLFLKSCIPVVVPFYADPMLAEIDRALHLGQDPWRLAHDLLSFVPARWLANIYFMAWMFPALGFMIFIAVFDGDRLRVRRFGLLYLICWVGLGNIVALIGSSVGPVFYDMHYGGSRFADFQRAFASSGLADTTIRTVNDLLWRNYASQSGEVGASISAFPSVHVGIAMLVMLYAAERSRLLLVPGVVFLVTILILSVYTGYHYAIDGYFSILFMGLAWLALRSRQMRQLLRAQGVVGETVTAPVAE